MEFKYDVLVIGGGHAGCEAACAAANMGAHTCLITMDMNKIAQMSCNPAIGGIAKGQIVREIDALGGQMGRVTDTTAIQFKMLNRGKGPAVWSPRAQCDRGKYIWQWRSVLDNTPNLDIWQDQAEKLLVENLTAVGIRTIWGITFHAKSIIITAGTFLNGLMHIGRHQYPGGRCAEPAVTHLTESITRWGIRSGRMKTGTPVRIDKRSIHFEDTEKQTGENDFHQFSYLTPHRKLDQLPCWTCYTNKAAHDILRKGIPDSPLYNGQIKSIGPRYCPSIETKLTTFPDKDQHPLFIEPEGVDTNEMYLNGFSSSMPIEIQLEALHQIPALRDAKIYRPGYAIEYDFFDPTQLNHALESKILRGLFFAGQVNGTTGYEEAGGQGIVAGINAAINCSNGEYFVMHRDESYIGVLIDDLVTCGVDEPYRMFTSRAEYRILLRQDNADERLTEKSYRIGLAKQERFDFWTKKKMSIQRIIEYCKELKVKPERINPLLEELKSAPIHHSCKLSEILSRPEISFNRLTPYLAELRTFLDNIPDRKEEIIESAEIRIKYKGYIDREVIVANKMHRLENIKIKDRFNYDELKEISTEGRQKLKRINPETIGQASRIPGVSPSDINVLLILLKR
ncbi:MAG: tRNA uridine-5-carboxymethylaminomethyl(34) synthesis enzyme MnmG [Prevotella sp.]|nr:tRNA uridine-5-carboxymethylaminomethyl(34) synthesis enzyme MnmG [Prevotella sp.]